MNITTDGILYDELLMIDEYIVNETNPSYTVSGVYFFLPEKVIGTELLNSETYFPEKVIGVKLLNSEIELPPHIIGTELLNSEVIRPIPIIRQ